MQNVFLPYWSLNGSSSFLNIGPFEYKEHWKWNIEGYVTIFTWWCPWRRCELGNVVTRRWSPTTQVDYSFGSYTPLFIVVSSRSMFYHAFFVQWSHIQERGQDRCGSLFSHVSNQCRNHNIEVVFSNESMWWGIFINHCSKCR